MKIVVRIRKNKFYGKWKLRDFVKVCLPVAWKKHINVVEGKV